MAEVDQCLVCGDGLQHRHALPHARPRHSVHHGLQVEDDKGIDKKKID